MRISIKWRVASAFLLLAVLSGCRSAWVCTRIENQSGETIHQLEVDYPSASFGADSLAAGATMQYRFQIRGNGPITLQYTFGNGQAARAKGPVLSDGQHGGLTIRLQPQGKAVFDTNLKPAS